MVLLWQKKPRQVWMIIEVQKNNLLQKIQKTSYGCNFLVSPFALFLWWGCELFIFSQGDSPRFRILGIIQEVLLTFICIHYRLLNILVMFLALCMSFEEKPAAATTAVAKTEDMRGVS